MKSQTTTTQKEFTPEAIKKLSDIIKIEILDNEEQYIIDWCREIIKQKEPISKEYVLHHVENSSMIDGTQYPYLANAVVQTLEKSGFIFSAWYEQTAYNKKKFLKKENTFEKLVNKLFN